MSSQAEAVVAITKQLTDEGRLVEAGFTAMQVIALEGASDAQIHDMRLAFMAGADHLFSSIISILDPDAEPTPKDLQRMDLIDGELEKWRTLIASYFDKTPAGHA